MIGFGLAGQLTAKQYQKALDQLEKAVAAPPAPAAARAAGLEAPIKTDAVDEIGQLTRALERLRKSMAAAMSRLGGQ